MITRSKEPHDSESIVDSANEDALSAEVAGDRGVAVVRRRVHCEAATVHVHHDGQTMGELKKCVLSKFENWKGVSILQLHKVAKKIIEFLDNLIKTERNTSFTVVESDPDVVLIKK